MIYDMSTNQDLEIIYNVTRATGWLTEVHWAIVFNSYRSQNLCLFDGAEAFFMDGSQSVQCNRNGKNQVTNINPNTRLIL